MVPAPSLVAPSIARPPTIAAPPPLTIRLGTCTAAAPVLPVWPKVSVLAPSVALAIMSCTVQASTADAAPFHTVPATVITGLALLTIPPPPGAATNSIAVAYQFTELPPVDAVRERVVRVPEVGTAA